MKWFCYRTRPLATVQTDFTTASRIIDVSDKQCMLNRTSYAWQVINNWLSVQVIILITISYYSLNLTVCVTYSGRQVADDLSKYIRTKLMHVKLILVIATCALFNNLNLVITYRSEFQCVWGHTKCREKNHFWKQRHNSYKGSSFEKWKNTMYWRHNLLPGIANGAWLQLLKQNAFQL